MNFTVILESETKTEVSSPLVAFLFDFDLYSPVIKKSKLIKYLDPYGDTTFNSLQMNDLISDLKKLNEINNDGIIEKIIDLAFKCKIEPHTYLTFYGD